MDRDTHYRRTILYWTVRITFRVFGLCLSQSSCIAQMYLQRTAAFVYNWISRLATIGFKPKYGVAISDCVIVGFGFRINWTQYVQKAFARKMHFVTFCGLNDEPVLYSKQKFLCYQYPPILRNILLYLMRPQIYQMSVVLHITHCHVKRVDRVYR